MGSFQIGWQITLSEGENTAPKCPEDLKGTIVTRKSAVEVRPPGVSIKPFWGKGLQGGKAKREKTDLPKGNVATKKDVELECFCCCKASEVNR